MKIPLISLEQAVAERKQFEEYIANQRDSFNRRMLTLIDPNSVIPPLTENNSYIFTSEEISKKLGPEYLDFLKRVGYGNHSYKSVEIARPFLSLGDPNTELYIGKELIEDTCEIRNYVEVLGLNIGFGKSDERIINYINSPEAIQLVGSFGGIVLTTRLMFELLIPFLKSSSDLYGTLYQMREHHAEWLASETLIGAARDTDLSLSIYGAETKSSIIGVRFAQIKLIK